MGLDKTWNIRLMWMLILTDDPEKLRRIEHKLEASRATVVNAMIEETDWVEHMFVAEFFGDRGSPEERLASLRRAWRWENGSKLTDDDQTGADTSNRALYEAIDPSQRRSPGIVDLYFKRGGVSPFRMGLKNRTPKGN